MKKEMLINVLQPEECRIAIVEDGILEELYVERTSLENYTGNIYKGRIVNIEPAIQAAFVDFSVGRNGFLHVSDVEPQYYRRLLADDAELGGRDRGRDPRPRPSSRDEPRSSAPRRPSTDEPRDRDRPRDTDRDEPRSSTQRRSPADDPRDRDRPRDTERDEPRAPQQRRSPVDDPRDRDRDRDRPRDSARDEPRAPQQRRSPVDDPRDRDRDRDRDRPRDTDRDEPRPLRGGPIEGPRERDRSRDLDRDTPRRRTPPPEDRPRRDFGPSLDEPPTLPPQLEDRSRERPTDRDRGWGWGKERPDRSEKGRQDRSPRSFGEGLIEESELEPYKPRRRPEPTPVVPEPTPPPEPEPLEPPAPPAPIEAELPPSRTRRTRPTAPPPPEAVDPTPDDEPLPSFRRPRTRPTTRTPRASEPVAPPNELPFEPVPPAADFGQDSDEFPPVPDSSEPPPRRGGRAAIRARGGEREPDRVRDTTPQHPRGLAAERPYEPPDTLWPDKPEPPADIEPPRERPAPRSAERERPAEPPAPRSRGRGFSRAGEPGYVPRRERLRDRDQPTPPDREPPTADEPADDSFGWGLADREPTPPVAPPPSAAPTAAPDDDDDQGDGRRRRRRRRPRPRPSGELDSPEILDELHIEEPTPPPPTRGGYRSARVEDDRTRSYEDDFGDASEFVEDEDEAAGIIHESRSTSRADDRIDPELEEEIRREIEEIAELEREMGLRDGGPEPRRGRGAEAEPAGSFTPGAARPGRSRASVKPPIQEVFRRGDEALIQVIKESIGTKGPTLSTYISIPGRYLVLMPGLNRVGVSRKIADEGQRRKLREIMHDLNPPKGLGFIVRTAGLERTKRELAKDLAYLLRLWKTILKRIRKTRGPAPIYQESDMIIRTIRDVFSSDIDTIWIDEPAAYERALDFMKVVMPKFADRVKLYDERVPLFHKYGIEEEIAKIQRRHVPLPEGGSIVIDQTEALVAIDVNSGNFRVEDDAEKTAYEMNLRAAKEIARQLRLRDLGGVIVNDFIDMRDERHRRGVERALRDAMKRDRARTKILRMSQFGLVEMTRQRIRPSLKRSVYEDCPHCKGAGVAKTVESMAIDVMRLLALAAHRNDVHRIHVTVHPNVEAYLNNRKRPELAQLEVDGKLTILVRHEDHVAADHLVMECTDPHGNEVRVLPQTPSERPRRR